MSTIRLAIFTSGNGSNAEQITNYFHHDEESKIRVELILSNNAKAFVLERAKKLNVDSIVFNRYQFSQTEEIVNLLLLIKIDYVILAGFLWLIPKNLIAAFTNKIINIHPALLPKYGGKGMYGSHVHEAVVKNKEKETGITVHLVDEIYDNGKILRQEKCSVSSSDAASDLAKKVHLLEHKYFPLTIKEYINPK